MVFIAGFEPAKPGFLVQCVYQLQPYEDMMVPAAGFEPATFRVWTERSDQLSYAGFLE